MKYRYLPIHSTASSGRGLLALIASFLVVGSVSSAFGQADCSVDNGQRICAVSQGVGTLNIAIDGDTTATGDRVDENTIYQLESGGIYLLSGSIENRFPLTIMAEPGATERPRLIPAVDEGGESSRAFRARDDLYLNGLYVTDEDELGQLNERIIRVSADSVRIRLENVHLDRDAQTAFRLDNDGARIFINNSIVSNIGTMASPDNGRVIDDRGNGIDSLVITNSTMYNNTAMVVRDAGGPNNFIYLRHNTMHNQGQLIARLGETKTVQFVNNVIVNGGFLGMTPINSDFVLVSVDSVSDGEQTVNIANNVFYLDPAIVAVFPDSASESPWFNETAMNFIEANGTGDTNFEEALAFANAPESPTDIVAAFYAGDENLDELDNGLTGERKDPEVDVNPFDFSYADTFMSYTASSLGQPLGDLNWFMMMPTANEPAADLPQGFRLVGNYPNPFNPSTTIAFELDHAAEVGLTVFDVMGREVMTVEPVTMAPGEGTINLRADGLASGLYVYRLRAKTAAETVTLQGRMTLLK